ncbi:hypothetical protein [Methylobacterium gnaphalii]|uniref:Uncharacterized protein n=1 Tax=Methylobacterium gnaphalii TaxID=1010610 RepID=A0A512JPB5_9HYPH|nr:hypothetical protein [Methylobacterium gnaphalii]GEP11788.1 hypothetical protein MGN01_36330 [Methylobacterium gnaphalii]GJD69465.1 hypothetical protein MMMDOFMJ_2396 [Methylobacterium gnaphalii]GLS49577.1 hypothetical protein GCM10007885_24260 [Methylobacterium gnaphalii]
MTRDADLGARVRMLCGAFHAEAVTLSAALLDAIEAAHGVLQPVADHRSPAGIAAAVAFQILADAIADAKPPEPVKL